VVRNLANNSILGYLSSNLLNGILYSFGDISQGLIVNFEAYSTGVSTQINLAPENSGSGFGYVGLTQGSDDGTSILAAGFYQYALLTGTDKTAPGATPADTANSFTAAADFPRDAESAVWNYDSNTNLLSLHWVNPDGSTPSLQTFLVDSSINVGDAAAFKSTFHYPSPVPLVGFEFVKI